MGAQGNVKKVTTFLLLFILWILSLHEELVLHHDASWTYAVDPDSFGSLLQGHLPHVLVQSGLAAVVGGHVRHQGAGC